MASFAVGGVAPVVALERTQHLSGTFDFGGPIDTLPRRNVVYANGEGDQSAATTTATGASGDTAAAAPKPAPKPAQAATRTFDAASGGQTVTQPNGTTRTEGSTPAEQAGLVKQALGPGVSVGVGNLVGFNKDGSPIVSKPATQVGGGTPAPADENPVFQTFRQNVADNIAKGQVTEEQGKNPIGMGPGGTAIYGPGK